MKVFNLKDSILNYRKISFLINLPEEERAKIIFQQELELRVLKNLHKAKMHIEKYGEIAQTIDSLNNPFLYSLTRILTKDELDELIKATKIIPIFKRVRKNSSRDIGILLERSNFIYKLLSLKDILKPRRHFYKTPK